MSYFKINNIDFSRCVNALSVVSAHNYNAQTNASGDTVVDYLNQKRQIEVGIIPLTQTEMAELLAQVNQFNVSISFLNPLTKQIETIDCIIPENNVNYYTIQAGNIKFKDFTLNFIEL